MMPVLTPKQIWSFWRLVNKLSPTECWLWEGTLTDNGYGQFRIGKFLYLAHRISWALSHGGEWPAEDIKVCHSCDTPWCIQPLHLFLGTQLENIRDMYAKGRSGILKVSEQTRREILDLSRVFTAKSISKVYGLHVSSIYLILKDTEAPDGGYE